ncbi:NotI family restriction endonuclease [Desulfococcaceae bacterium HSG9]|nr:NotI family restriction endonuclease [Desulfococcaceae bacterium HSG9]
MKRDLIEIFGYSPDDLTVEARSLWNLEACPFIEKSCIKYNHDKSIAYGTCSVTSPYGDIIICPNRLYENNYESIKRISKDVYGDNLKFYFFDEYIKHRNQVEECVVALGKNSGKEVKIGNSLSMDWVLARIINGHLKEYVGIEVQSIDITGNYRDTWHAYNNLPLSKSSHLAIPSSNHGLNWANVYKRLIPQLIRKGIVYSRSRLVRKGLYFIVPDIVYMKFEDIIGEIPKRKKAKNNTITVFTYKLGRKAKNGKRRKILPSRTIRFLTTDFANRFIKGPNLPSGDNLDDAVSRVLGIK